MSVFQNLRSRRVQSCVFAAILAAVSGFSVGGIYDFPVAKHLKLGIGALVSKYGIPDVARPYYGSDPTSYMVFFRLKLS